MFSKSKSRGNGNGGGAVAAPAAPSIISRDLRIVGDLHSDGEVQIDGGIEGDIRAGTLLIGETADIRGEIVADSVVVHGRLTGQIKAKSVNLASTAHVIGDILHEDLAIETGAFLEGHCKRIVEEPKPKAQPQAPSKVEKAADDKAAEPKTSEGAANAVVSKSQAAAKGGSGGNDAAKGKEAARNDTAETAKAS